MASEPINWPDLAAIKDYLNIADTTDDAYLQSQLDATIASIETYLGKEIPYQEVTKTLTSQNNSLSVSRWPIDEVVSLVDSELLTTINFTVGSANLIYGDFGHNKKFTIHYFGGITPIPADLLDVFYQIISIRYQLKTYKPSLEGKIKSESIPGVNSVSYADDKAGNLSGFGLVNPANFSYVLDNYKTYHV